jgi:hypothetical protein
MAGERLTWPETAGGLDGGRGYPAAGGRGSLRAGPHLLVTARKKKRGKALRWAGGGGGLGRCGLPERARGKGR